MNEIDFSRWCHGREYGVAIRGLTGGERYFTLDQVSIIRDIVESATTPPARAEFIKQIDEWSEEPDLCGYPMCGNWAVDGRFCAPHIPDAA